LYITLFTPNTDTLRLINNDSLYEYFENIVFLSFDYWENVGNRWRSHLKKDDIASNWVIKGADRSTF